MAHKGSPEFLCVVVDVFGEVEHDDDPDIVGSDLHISVVVVCLEEGTKEAIVEMGALVGLAGLFVSEESSLAVLVPQRLAVEVVGLSWLAFEGLQVDDLISLALHINDLLQKPARLIIRPTDQYILYFYL